MLKGAKGNNRAIREIWDTWTPRIDLFFRKSVPERDRDDLIQDTMIKIYGNLDQYNPMFAPSTWIYSIAQRVKIDYLRAQSHSARHLYANDDILERLPSRSDSPAETVRYRLKLLKKRLKEELDQ